MAKWMARRNALQGIAQLKFDLKYGFIDAAVQQVKDLTEILRDFPADAILADFCFLGAAWLHEQGGPPWAGFSVPTLQALASENVLVVATIFDRLTVFYPMKFLPTLALHRLFPILNYCLMSM
jgi:hypothetical protein